MNPQYWNNKKCLVTGASSGLGAVLAGRLVKCGADVALVARDQEKLSACAATLADRGGRVRTLVADLTREEDVLRLHDQIKTDWQELDFLCNCAGRSDRGKVLDTAPDDFQQLLEVNFLAAVRTTRAFATMLTKERGHLVNIGSLASKVAPRYMGGYAASKFALAAYSQQLRLELGPEGLHVLLVCPGPIRRDDNQPRYEHRAEDLPDSAMKPAAGARLRGIEPGWLAEKILTACEKRKLELVVPWKVRLLLGLSQFSPSLGDWLLLRATRE